MQPRFIVIEPSIKDEGGHYLQYGLSVLRAARERGYKPVLACHKDFPVQPIEDIEVHAVFSHTFWHRFEMAGRGRSIKAKLFQRMLTVHSGISRRFQAWWYFTPAYSVFGNVLGPFFSRKTVHRRLGLLRTLRYSLTDWITDFFVHNAVPPNRSETANEAAIQQLTSDIVSLGRKLALTEKDELLLATVSGAELESLVRAIALAPELNGAGWHLVFRRNLKHNPAGKLLENDVESDLVYSALAHYTAAKSNVHLYTDTGALTAEYNEAAREAIFRTLPIPHIKSPEGHVRNPHPFVISYLGDARAEKGFQHLPYVVKSLEDDPGIEFRFQANFSSSADALCQYARKELERSERVTLITQAQSEDDYQNCIASSHIVLIPYDHNNYSARSSGIFAECLGMEVPVVVPAGTWMSRQLRKVEYRELAEAFGRSKPESFGALASYPLDSSKGVSNPLERRWFVEWDQVRLLISPPIPSGSTQAVLRIRVPNRWYVRARVDQRDTEGTLLRSDHKLLELLVPDGIQEAFALIDLDSRAVNLQLTLMNYSLSDVIDSHSIQIAFLRAENRLEPFGLGEVYYDRYEIPDLVRKIRANFDRYQAGTRDFGPVWRSEHSGEGLMRALNLGGGSP